MIHSVRFIAVLDTNIIYPIEIRDILFWFAFVELYTPKWSAHIFNEWETVMKRKGVPEEQITSRIKKANDAFPPHKSAPVCAFKLKFSVIITAKTAPIIYIL